MQLQKREISVMDLCIEINNWIQESGAFAIGMKLYERTGLKQHSKRWEAVMRKNLVTASDKDALKAVLENYCNEKYQQVARMPVEQSKEQEPAEIKDLRKRAIELRKRYSYLHAQLSTLNDDHDRYQIAEQIMEELIPEEDKIWNAIREWQRTGIAPVNVALSSDIVKDTVEKMQRVYNLRTRVSKYNTDLKKSKNDLSKQRLELNLLRVKTELAQLENELGLNDIADE